MSALKDLVDKGIRDAKEKASKEIRDAEDRGALLAADYIEKHSLCSNPRAVSQLIRNAVARGVLNSEPVLAPENKDVDCRKCDFAGMDMDMDIYCSHPKVLVDHGIGLNVNRAFSKYCSGKLYMPRTKR